MSIYETYNRNQENIGRLLVKCPDKPGIVAALSNFLFKNGADIMESAQHSSDDDSQMFYIRFEFYLEQLLDKQVMLDEAFRPLAESFSMEYEFTFKHRKKRVAIFVSKETHCLMELLWEWQNNELQMEIPLVISNHENARQMVEALNIPFHYIPAHKDIRQDVEAKQIQLMKEYNIDVIILARYMQILTPDFVAAFPERIINIHHSFLPAFIGARPYERAHERGVKLIGATSHFVTNDLDEGPIIEQDIERVDHRDNINALKKIGQQVERRVLIRAVKWYLQDRVIVKGNKTIVFQ